MTSTPLNEIVHRTIKDLHTLHSYPITEGESNYETLLKETIKRILQLLNYHDKLYRELNLTVASGLSDIGSISLLYYLGRTSHEREQITNSNIFAFLQSYRDQRIDNRSSRSYVLKQLVKLLSVSDSTHDDKKPKRIKGSFSMILMQFSELLDFFVNLHSESEEKLVHYINRCFNYELNIYSDLKEKLDSGMGLDDHDTERIVGLLDDFIGNKNSQENNSVDDINDSNPVTDTSIFSYESNEGPSHVGLNDSPLHFQCNDQNFSNLYQIFLQISSFKSLHIESKSMADYSKYIRIMISLYKKSNDIDTLEVNDFKYKEMKYNFFYNFFLGGNLNEDRILPSRYEEINKRIINEMIIFPELYHENKYEIYRDRLISNDSFFRSGSETIPSHTVKHSVLKSSDNLITNNDERNSMSNLSNYSNDDQITLIDNLRYIIPLLNDFDFNFNVNFPSILKLYMKLLYNDLPDFAVQDDANYIERIVTLVENIIDYENEDSTSEEYNIRGTILHFYELHNSLSKNALSKDDVLCTKMMRLAICEYYDMLQVKSNTFHKWNYKTLAISQLEYILNYEWLPMRKSLTKKNILQKWFGRTLTVDKLESTTMEFYHQDLLSKTFKDMWQFKLLKHNELSNKGNLYFLNRWFKLWTQKSNNLKLLHNRSLKHNRTRLLKSYFGHFLDSFQNHQDLRIIASSKHQSLLLKENLKIKSFAIKNWYTKMNQKIEPQFITRSDVNEVRSVVKLDVSKDLDPPSTLSEKLRRLGNIEKYIIYSKYFKTLKHAQEIRHTYTMFQLKSDRMLLLFFLNDQWLKKAKLRQKAKYILQEKEDQIKTDIFSYWKISKNQHCIADKFKRKNALELYFNKWKLEHVMAASDFNHSRLLQNQLSSTRLKFYLTKWILAYQLKYMVNKSEVKILSFGLDKILMKSKENMLMASKAALYDTTNLKRKFLALWTLNYRRKILMNEISELNVQRKFLNKIIGKHHFYSRELPHRAEKYDLTKGQNLNDRLIQHTMIRYWQLQYDSKFQTTSNYKIKVFNEDILIPSVKSRHFISWVGKFNDRQVINSHLDFECDKFIKRLPSRKIFLRQWLDATHKRLTLRTRAKEFEIRLLCKKFLVIWYDQFLHANRYLNELSDDFINQKDFSMLREILSNWSMKYIKNVERNRQSSELFVKRWQNVKAKSILELWIYKLREKLDADIISNNTRISNQETSLINNLSPLAKKSIARNTTITENKYDGSNSSYLYTPLKQEGRLPRTPHHGSGSAVSSPTKLQETTQRLKNERIGALRKHFSKVRATSTPRKEFQAPYGDKNGLLEPRLVGRNNSKFIRLSPPKAANYVPILPPKPPNFAMADIEEDDGGLYINHDNTSKLSSAAIDENEKSIIETAKRMRRITPIFVPLDDEISEPRFSPVKKLKERLRNNLIEISPTKEIQLSMNGDEYEHSKYVQ